MSKLFILVKGELTRLKKYHVTTISLIVTLMWFLLLYFIDDQNLLKELLPFIIIIDATMMSIVFIGAIMFFEKTEQTFSTMLVTPVTNQQLILSKAIANTIHTLFSSMLIIIVFHFVKDVEVNWLAIILALVVSVFFHSLLGFVFSFHSKDFTTMLVNVMIYFFIFALPSVLNSFNILFKGKTWEYLLLLSPTQASIKLVEASFGGSFDIKYFLSLFILIVGGLCGYLFYILKKFKSYAVKQSGV
jgi:fluoroquinolone transport system permease protein